MDGECCFFLVPIILVLCGVFVIVVSRREDKRQLAQAYDYYQQALTALRNNPTTPAAREQALHYGRAYLYVIRMLKVDTGFTEARLQRDLDATVSLSALGSTETSNG